MHGYVDNIQTVPSWIKIKQENLEMYIDHVYILNSVMEMYTKWEAWSLYFHWVS